MIYKTLRWFFKIAVFIFFRRIEVEGVDNVPLSGPVLLAPNHPNALVDALVIVINLDRTLSVTAKSTLMNIPLLRYMIRATNVILLHRKKDAALGADTSRNVEALAECRHRLDQDAAILMFPEGQSHSDSSLRPLRLGVARIALDSLESEGAASRVKIIPVGLHFPEKSRFRSDVWVRFGAPLDPARWKAANPDEGPLELTAELESRIKELTLNFERMQDSVLLTWAAEILGTEAAPPARLGLEKSTVSHQLKLVKLLNRGYKRLKDDRSEEIAKLRKQVRAYGSELRSLKIAASEVFIIMTGGRAARFIARELIIVITGFPIALWGAVNHIIPAVIIRVIAVKLSTEKDKWASNVVLPAIALFPFFYALQISAAFFILSPLWALFYIVSLPLSGIFAILYRDRGIGIWKRSRTFILFRRKPALRERLMIEGRAIIDELNRLGEMLENN